MSLITHEAILDMAPLFLGALEVCEFVRQEQQSGKEKLSSRFMQEAATSSSVICEGSDDASAQHISMLVETCS